MTSVSESQNNMTTAFFVFHLRTIHFKFAVEGVCGVRECETFIYQACNYTILACQCSPGQEQKVEPIYSI